MATIANLRVIVSATTSKFSKKLRAVAATAKKFGKSMRKIGKVVAKFGAALGVAAVGGLTLLTKQAFSAIDAMAKLSGAIGISTEKLAGLQLAAELSGISTEALDKALKKMVRGVGQAGQGLSTQVKAFKALGLTFEELKAKGPGEQFAIIAERMRGLGSAAERAAIAADIFGKAGIDLLNIFAGGGQFLEEAQKQADALGLSMSNVDAKQVELANDAFLAVKRSLTGIGRQIAIGVSPFVKNLSKQFVEAATAGGGIREKVGGALRDVGTVMFKLLDVVDWFKKAWLTAQRTVLVSLQGMTQAFNDWIQAYVNLINTILPQSQKLANVNRFAEEGFRQTAEEIDERIAEIMFKGEQRSTKFFDAITKASKEAATKAVAEQKAAFTGVSLIEPADKKQKEQERRLQIGFRGEAFAAALAAGGAGKATGPTLMETKQDETNTLLEQINRNLERFSVGLA